MRKENGFTLIELLAVIALTAILFTLGATAVRHFWQVRSLQGAQDEVVTELRRSHQRAASETHPLVYGAKFHPNATFEDKAARWTLVRYDPTANSGAGSCVTVATRRFDAGVYVRGASFATSTAASFCAANLPAETGDQFVFFYAKGSATAGDLTLAHDGLGRTKAVAIAGVTGRVEKQ